jgi:hypothetical protein
MQERPARAVREKIKPTRERVEVIDACEPPSIALFKQADPAQRATGSAHVASIE